MRLPRYAIVDLVAQAMPSGAAASAFQQAEAQLRRISGSQCLPRYLAAEGAGFKRSVLKKGCTTRESSPALRRPWMALPGERLAWIVYGTGVPISVTEPPPAHSGAAAMAKATPPAPPAPPPPPGVAAGWASTGS